MSESPRPQEGSSSRAAVELPSERKKSKYAREVDYLYIRERLLKSFRRNALSRRRAACYDAALLVQLANGSRVSEACEALARFIAAGEREMRVRVRKKKRYEDRLMVVPRVLDREELVELCSDLAELELSKLVNRVKKYAEYAHGIRTHALRYAYITYLQRAGESLGIISKAVGHSRLDYILTYTQKREADELVRRWSDL